ncbi:MAG TPA: peptidase MA family metallohydrolase, partial [Myxococcaceae bacterium]|nr:peptidase MA family metallohydrolase [Myxococcaceae bacterium]
MIRSLASAAALLLLLAAAPAAHAALLADESTALIPAESGGSSPSVELEVPAPPPALVAGEVTTPRFRILYTQRSEASARALAARIERVRDAFHEVLGRDWPGVTEIRVGLGREEMEQLSLDGAVPAWAEALAYPERNVILLDARSLLKPDGEVTLRHELSHVALGQLAPSWPRWFQEGIALYLTGDRFSITQYAAMFRAVTRDRLFDFEDLAESWPQQPQDVEIAYAQSVVFVAHLVDRFGPQKLGELVDHVRAGAPFEVAFARAFQTSVGVEQEAWKQELPRRYSWTPIVTGGSVFWGLAALLVVAAWVRRRRVRSLRYAQMAAQEAAEDAAVKLAATAQLEASP